MVTHEKVDILAELETFLDELEYYKFSRLPFIAMHLPARQVAYIGNLRNKLIRDVGKFSPFITELIAPEEPHLIAKEYLQSSDLWLKGLDLQFDLTASRALDYCLDVINMAIGRLQDDLRRGRRDKEGNLIEINGTEPPKAFISHGTKSESLDKIEEFLRAIGIEPLIIEHKPSLDKALPDKVDFYLNTSDFVVILATGDDKIKGKRYPRQNVIHEIGLAQRTFPGKIIYLLEQNTEFPSNIKPKVWEMFNQNNIENVFSYMVSELREYGILKAVKSPKGV